MAARIAGTGMHRLFKTLLILPWLSACGPSFLPGGLSNDWHAGAPPGARHDFNWRLSGDRRVAPLQVFDDGQQTWLQFPPGRPVPAIFVQYGGREFPAESVSRQPYVVVKGKWPALVLRGGALHARADYVGRGPHDAGGDGGFVSAAGSQADAALAQHRAAAFMPASSASAHSGSLASTAAAYPPAHAPEGVRNPRAGNATPRGQAPAATTQSYRAGPGDENMRRALSRWAGLAGWTFEPEHWAVDVDIPLSGSAAFSDDFKHSVRELLAATELGERPLQPCFYANQVLRVVPLSEACDRTALRAGAAS